MIEKYIKNDLTLKRWRYFKQKKLAIFCCYSLLFMIFLSFTAEFWSNNKPIMMSYNNKLYFPMFKTYAPSEFNQLNLVKTNYKQVTFDEDNKGWILWPAVKWGPYETNLEPDTYPAPPSADNLLGTDDRGRDVLSRLLYGLRYSLIYAVFVWIITFVIGICLGGIMGYYGGKVDFFGQRIVEILNSVPQFFLLIIIISVYEPSLMWLIIVSCLFGWISISYYIRGEFLKNRQREFVEAAKSMGASTKRIIFKHILPNSLSPVITYSPFNISANITALAGLDYLGFGLQPPTPSWGELLNQAQQNFTIAWWLALYPSLVLFLTLAIFIIIGDAIRDAMDPHRT